MDQIAYSFCFTAPASLHHHVGDHATTELDESVTVAMQNACDHAMRSHQCQAVLCTSDKFTVKRRTLDTQGDYNITLTGATPHVLTARGDLLRGNLVKVKLSVKASRSELLDSDNELKENLKPAIDKIVNDTNATVNVALHNTGRATTGHSESTAEIVINGPVEAAEAARIRVLVMLDDMTGLRTDTLFIPHKLHNLISGRKRCYLQAIMEETAINIYFPSPFFDFSKVDRVDKTQNAGKLDIHERDPPIYLTGDSIGIGRAKEMLTKLSHQKVKSMYHKDSVLQPRKLDWMLMHRRDELRTIMYDNGSFLQFPPLGSGHNMVTVFAENRVNAERTLRSLNLLACHFYEAYFYIQPRDGSMFGNPMLKFYGAMSQLSALVAQLSQTSGAEVTFKVDGCIEVFGTERAVRNAYQRLHEMNFMKTYHRETIFNVELANEQREFISGKKNGKINKIMKTSGVKIRFVPYSEYNFVIEVSSTSFTKALDGLTLLQEELPAEVSFFVPESYHKRIIGVGGKNIQRIMKKYGVYVKFSNAEEFAALGGYYNNDDNVVARTPAKNALNLDNLKHAVMELVGAKDKDITTQIVTIPRRLHRNILIQHSAYIHDIEEKTNTRVRWPDRELGSEIVTIVGPESQIHVATQLLLELVPEDYYFRIPYSTSLLPILSSTDFRDQVTVRVKRELNITLIALPPRKTDTFPDGESNKISDMQEYSMVRSSSSAEASESSLSSSPDSNASLPPYRQEDDKEKDYIFTFKFSRNNTDCLHSAIDILTEFLKEKQVTLYPEAANEIVRPRSDSFADAFPHFNSKLLSSVGQPESPTTTGFSSYSLFENGGTNAFDGSWKNIREPNAAQDGNLRSIFDNGHSVFEGINSSESDLSLGSPTNGHGFSATIHSTIPNNAATCTPLDIWTTNHKATHTNGGASGNLHGNDNINIVHGLVRIRAIPRIQSIS
ncbi:hypothetical protein BC936DRAFT_139809, partial [Jimgerdemannia flammicorona]